MSDVTLFTQEEIVKIGAVKVELEAMIKAAQVFEYHGYHDGNYKKYNLTTLDSLENMVIAGGVFASIMKKTTPNDIDVFILNKDLSLFNILVLAKPGKWTVKYFLDEDADNRPDDYKNPHVLATAFNADSKVQYILTDHKNRKDLLADFDYIHCTASYYVGKLYINRETFDSINNFLLVRQHKNKRPKAWREQKFIGRGWQSEADQLLNAPPKTLADILKDKLDQPPVFKRVGLDSSWNTVYPAANPSISQAWHNAVYGTDISLDDLDPYLQTK